MTEHPGTIQYFKEDQLVSTDAVADVPEHLRFARDANGVLTPVVKVVARTGDDIREIFEYGPQGQLLRVTKMRLG